MPMSTQAKGLLLLVVVVAYASGAQGQFSTWISNGASRSIVATTSYAKGKSQFVNRVISPGTSQKDDYGYPFGIHVELWVNGAGQHNSVNIGSDRSLVGFDHGAGSTGVDIFLAQQGTLFQKDGDVLVTIFLNGLPNTTHELT